MSSEKSLTPQIRFKGFTEAWEQRKAIDLFKDVSEKGFDNLPVLSATQDRGMVYRDENGINISHDKKNELTYKHVIPGQFVIHLRSFQGGFAHSSIEGITSPAYTVFRFSNESQHDDIFWKYIFMSERFIKSLETVTYGIRDGRSISYSEFLGLPFAVPEKEEESRVGYFLKKYDSLITLHQRKLDALKKIKSALLEKMFPKDGSNIPEIRFTGFTEAWEQRKLGDIAAFSKGQGFSKSNLTDSGSPVILYGRLYTNYETQICKVDTFVKNSSCGVLSKGGEVIVPASGETAEDIAVASHVSLPGILLGGDLNVVTPKDNLDSNFLALFITFGNAHVELSKRAQGKSVVHVRNGDLSQLNIKYPTQSEQILISNLFIKNDNLITLHQRKLK